MKITAELSLYPLKTNYEEYIIDFIRSLKSSADIEVLTTAMSTYVKGESSEVFKAINNALAADNEETTFSLVIKLINRDLPVQDGFLNF